MKINNKLKKNSNFKVEMTLKVYRYGHYLYKSPKKLNKIPYLFLKIINRLILDNLYGIEIPFKTRIGPGLRLSHLNGIVISENASIGCNCTIFHQVTIGANEHKNSFQSAPIIGDNVYIGAGAKIIGDIKIGDNVKIGANAVVTKNVPSRHTVVGHNKIILTTSERQPLI